MNKLCKILLFIVAIIILYLFLLSKAINLRGGGKLPERLTINSVEYRLKKNTYMYRSDKGSGEMLMKGTIFRVSQNVGSRPPPVVYSQSYTTPHLWYAIYGHNARGGNYVEGWISVVKADLNNVIERVIWTPDDDETNRPNPDQRQPDLVKLTDEWTKEQQPRLTDEWTKDPRLTDEWTKDPRLTDEWTKDPRLTDEWTKDPRLTDEWTKEPQPRLTDEWTKEQQPRLTDEWTKDPRLTDEWTKEQQPRLTDEWTKDPRLTDEWTKEQQPRLTDEWTIEPRLTDEWTKEQQPRLTDEWTIEQYRQSHSAFQGRETPKTCPVCPVCPVCPSTTQEPVFIETETNRWRLTDEMEHIEKEIDRLENDKNLAKKTKEDAYNRMTNHISKYGVVNETEEEIRDDYTKELKKDKPKF